MSQQPLLFTRRFGAMFSSMALGAFNDNFFKNALIVLITYRLAAETGQNAPLLISIASAAFIIPFFLFSGLAGNLADKLPKHRLVRILKFIEWLLYIGAGLALLSDHLWTMLVALFSLGTLSAFFGPVKYAILPELVKRNELLFATGLVEGGTYVSILIGTLLGALLVMQPNGAWIVACVLAVVGALGVVAAWRVPETKATSPNLKLKYNLVKSIWDMVRVALRDPIIFAAIMGISWFWSIGTTYLTQLPVFTKEIVGGNEQIVSLYMGIFTVGIAIGSFVCSRIARAVRSTLLAPLALLGVCLCGIDLCATGYRMDAPSGELIGLADYFTDFAHFHLVFDLSLMAFCGGLFIVPLYTLLQTDSSDAERARVIASNNVVNALMIAIAALLAAGFYALQLTVLQVLLIFALLNVPVIGHLWLRRHKD